MTCWCTRRLPVCVCVTFERKHTQPLVFVFASEKLYRKTRNGAERESVCVYCISKGKKCYVHNTPLSLCSFLVFLYGISSAIVSSISFLSAHPTRGPSFENEEIPHRPELTRKVKRSGKSGKDMMGFSCATLYDHRRLWICALYIVFFKET